MRTERFLIMFSRVAAALVAAIGILVLLGWAFDVAALKSVLPGLATMKANAALAFVLSGAALWLLAGASPAAGAASAATRPQNARTWIARACAAAVALIGLLTLVEYVFGWDLHIDRLLAERLASATNGSYPGRMAPATAVNFVLLAAAFLLADLNARAKRWPAQWLVLAAALNSFMPLLGYAYGVESLYRLQAYSSMALHAALAFLVLCVGFLSARPTRGLMILATGSDAGGMLLRRLFPAALVVPSVLGWLRVQGQEAGYYTTALGTALYAAANVVVFSALIWWTARSVQRTEAGRRQAEDALRESREHARAIFEIALDGIVAMDHEGRITEFNPAAERIFRYRRDEVIGRQLADVIVPAALREQHRRGLARYLATGEANVLGRRVELPGMRSDGEQVTVELSITRMPGGGPPMFAGFIRDVTERKQAEAAREQLAAIVRFSDDAIIGKSLDGIITAWNPGAEKLFGYAAREAIGMPMQMLLPPERACEEPDILARIARGERVDHFETVRLTKDGSRVDVSATISPVRDSRGNIVGASTIARDVTERRRAEEALAAERTLLRTLIDALPDLVFTKDTTGRFSMCNAAELAHLGFAHDQELLGKTVFDFYPREMAEQYHADDLQTLSGRPVLNREEPSIDADGNRRWHLTTKVPLRDGTGNIVGLVGTSRDISERKQAQRKLEAQLERLNLLDQITRAVGERQDLQSIFQVVIRSLEDRLPIDFGCVCLYDALHESLTVTRVGIKSRSLAVELAMPEQARIDIDRNGLSRCVHGQLVYEPDIEQVKFPFPQRLAQGGLRSLVVAPLLVESKVFGILVAARREARGFSSGDCEFLRQLSEHVALAAHQAQLYGALQQAYEDLRRSQHTILQQERLRALGQMASGIAHDINNAISPVALYTESLLEREPNLSGRARDYLATIQRAIEDVAQTVTRMREFYRPREPQLVLASVDMNRIVEQVVDLTRARWSDVPQEKGIVIGLRTELADDLPTLMGAESEIRDALTNLIFNAVDAMPQGGTLTLCTSVESPEAGDDDRTARCVHMEVRDTGIGMDEETRRRCLEPFFTTKGERGTGLGLAMVYGMVQRHSAELEIDSEIGKGTTVRLIFPVSAPATIPAVRFAAPRAPSQRLRILIIDDDPLLIKSLRDTLEADGHVITSADGGQAGIETFVAAQKRGAPFAVVITDLGMPYVDGRKVAAAVRDASPATPVILLTGWGQRLLADNDVPPQVDRVLSKPPRLHELRSALAALTSGSA